MSGCVYSYPLLENGTEPFGYKVVRPPYSEQRRVDINLAIQELTLYVAKKFSPSGEPSAALRSAMRSYVKASLWYEVLANEAQAESTTLLLRTPALISINHRTIGQAQISAGHIFLGDNDIQPHCHVILPEYNGIPFYPDMDGDIFFIPDATEKQLRKLNVSVAWEIVCDSIVDERRTLAGIIKEEPPKPDQNKPHRKVKASKPRVPSVGG